MVMMSATEKHGKGANASLLHQGGASRRTFVRLYAQNMIAPQKKQSTRKRPRAMGTVSMLPSSSSLATTATPGAAVRLPLAALPSPSDACRRITFPAAAQACPASTAVDRIPRAEKDVGPTMRATVCRVNAFLETWRNSANSNRVFPRISPSLAGSLLETCFAARFLLVFGCMGCAWRLCMRVR